MHGPDIMRAQIDTLIDAASQPHITLQVLPFTAGLHPMHGPCPIFRFDAHDQPDIVPAAEISMFPAGLCCAEIKALQSLSSHL